MNKQYEDSDAFRNADGTIKETAYSVGAVLTARRTTVSDCMTGQCGWYDEFMPDQAEDVTYDRPNQSVSDAS